MYIYIYVDICRYMYMYIYMCMYIYIYVYTVDKTVYGDLGDCVLLLGISPENAGCIPGSLLGDHATVASL